MPELPSLDGSEPFSPEGFEAWYERVLANPAAAKSIADEIEANPKRAVEKFFTLSREQKDHFAKASHDALVRKAQPLLEELRRDVPGPVRLIPNTVRKPPGPGHVVSCDLPWPTPPPKTAPPVNSKS